jgi:ABC-type transporter Mla MlaB component
MLMLRVSYADNADGQRWSLCGHLAGPWVEELRAFWSNVRERAPRAHAVVDLTDVTFIDEAGERLLADMQRAGTAFVAGGVENKHVLSSLEEKGKRPLRRLMGHLGETCGKPAKANGGDK